MIDNSYRNKHPRSISINNNYNDSIMSTRVMTDNDPPPKASRMSLFSPSGKLPGTTTNQDESQLRGTFLSRRPNSLGAEVPGGGRGSGGRGGRGPGGRGGLVKAESYRIGRRHSAEIGSLSSSASGANRRSSDPEFASNFQTATSSVSNYQEVFAQMKSQNPTASLGALQQKTMARMAEIKKQRLAEQERIKQEEENERLKKEEEEMASKLKQTLAVKYMSKWMKKVDLEFKEDSSDRKDTSDRTTTAQEQTATSGNASIQNQSTPSSRAQIQRQGSFKRNSLDSSGGRNMNPTSGWNSNSEHNNSDNILTQLIPTGARNSIMMAGRNTILINRNNRRSSIDTNYTTQSSQLDNSIGMIGEDQGSNFAPRRSVGDLSSVHRLNSTGGLICDGSDRSGLTDDASGLLTDVDSVNQLSIFSGKSSTKSRKSSGDDDNNNNLNIEDEDENDYDDRGDNHNNITDDDDDCVSRLSDCVSRLSLHGAEDIEENEREKRARHLGLNNDDDDNMGERTSRRSDNNRLSQSLTTTRSDATSFARSVTSDFTTDVSIMSCGLIVGFTDRRNLVDHNGLIVEFSDRSSIIEKRRREREKKRASRAANNDNEDDDEHTHVIEEDINAWKEK